MVVENRLIEIGSKLNELEQEMIKEKLVVRADYKKVRKLQQEIDDLLKEREECLDKIYDENDIRRYKDIV